VAVDQREPAEQIPRLALKLAHLVSLWLPRRPVCPGDIVASAAV
jgi:hypothetical protein